MTIRYILCSFGTFFSVWVSCTKKNLATLLSTRFPENKNFELKILETFLSLRHLTSVTSMEPGLPDSLFSNQKSQFG
jgi:hypothetical protein